MKLSKLISTVNVESLCADAELEITGITNDSRSVKPGDLFIAVKGYQSDGHNFISAAVDKGAACIACEDMPEGLEIPYFTVSSSRLAEAIIASNFYNNPSKKLTMIGVTGTNGKTTVTTLVRQILENATGEKCGLIGTNKNIYGDTEEETDRTTPDSIELQYTLNKMIEHGCKYVVMEVSSHALFLNRVFGIRFAVGAFTNLTEDHLDFHLTMENYAETKTLLFKSCDRAVINIDDDYSNLMIKAAECPVYTFSAQGKDADLKAEKIELNEDSVFFNVRSKNKKEERAELHIPGMFSVYNALTALAVTENLEIPLNIAVEALKSCKGVKGRAEIVPSGSDFTVLIDYAHTPDAMKNILNTVRGYAKGRVVILFGCGGDRDRDKRPIMGKIAVDLADYVYITSDNPRTEDPGDIISDILSGIDKTGTSYEVIENRRDAIGKALADAQENDIIILAGKGHETYQIIGKEKFHFDEREIVKECLGI